MWNFEYRSSSDQDMIGILNRQKAPKIEILRRLREKYKRDGWPRPGKAKRP